MRHVLKVIIIVVLAGLLTLGLMYAYGGSKTVETKWETTPGAHEITVKWDRKWGVRHYDIYSKDVTGAIYTSDNVPFEKYEKIGSVSGLHGSFVDKNVESGHYYSYVIRGYSKDKLVCDSFDKNVTQYECAGLARPELGNDGYGENNENSPECLYLYVQSDGGISAEGIEVYRKAEGDEKYSLLKLEDVQHNQESNTFDIQDRTVTAGESYTYKVRTFCSEDGETLYSDYSDTVSIPAVNFIGEYSIKGLEADPATSKLKLTVKSDKSNANLLLDKGTIASLSARNEKGEMKTYELTLDDSAVIDAGEKAKLTFTCRGKTLPESIGSEGSLDIADEGVIYDIGILGYNELRFDFDKGTGTIFVDYDN